MKTLLTAMPIALLSVLSTPNLLHADSNNPPIASHVVFFDNSNVSSWTSISAYCWDAENTSSSNGKGDKDNWPTGFGQSMTQLYDNIYYYNYPELYVKPKLIFHNGSEGNSNQTADLDYVNHNLYSISGTTNDSKKTASNELFTGPTEGGTIYLDGLRDVNIIVLPTSKDACTEEFQYYKTISSSTLTQIKSGLYRTTYPEGTVAIEYNGKYHAINNGHLYDMLADKGEYTATVPSIANVCIPENAGQKIFFDNSSLKWSPVNAYCWTPITSNTVDKNADWGGVAMTPWKDNIWYYEPSKEYDKVIFNNYVKNGTNDQTNEMTFHLGYLYSGSLKGSFSGAEYASTLPTISTGGTIKFLNKYNWDTVKIIYSVVTTDTSKEGENTVEVLTDKIGDLYSYDCPEGTYMVAFTNGDSCYTEAYDFVAGKIYDADSANGKPLQLNFVYGDSPSNCGALNSYDENTGNLDHNFASNYGFFHVGNLTTNFFFTCAGSRESTSWDDYADSWVIVPADGNGTITLDNSKTFEMAEVKDGQKQNVPICEKKFTFKAYSTSTSAKPGVRTANAQGIETFSIASPKTNATYYLSLDWSNQTLRVLEIGNGVETGIQEVVEQEDTNIEPEYFTLQGVKVNNPSNGIYIKRIGNHVSKVVIR